MRDLLAEIREQHPSYSICSWATKLGFSNSGTLSKVLCGKHSLTIDVILALAKQHGLTEMELVYLQFISKCDGRISEQSMNIIADAMKAYELNRKVQNQS